MKEGHTNARSTQKKTERAQQWAAAASAQPFILLTVSAWVHAGSVVQVESRAAP